MTIFCVARSAHNGDKKIQSRHSAGDENVSEPSILQLVHSNDHSSVEDMRSATRTQIASQGRRIASQGRRSATRTWIPHTLLWRLAGGAYGRLSGVLNENTLNI